MQYPFEDLDPEFFQRLCQSLLVREFPNVQCFPIGQADGGRDATAYLSGDRAGAFNMYQVKFVRRPDLGPDSHRWLLKTIEGEIPKISQQISQGAKAYYLLTNVAGTGAAEAGSIDGMNAVLREKIGIPAFCWWRDDISRRLDNAQDLRWAYPQLVKGPDLIRALIESGLGEDRERRTTIIKAYVRDQYSRDEEVKFKQVELQNRLLDLFIDVPIAVPQHAEKRRYAVERHIAHEFAQKRHGVSDPQESSDGISSWHHAGHGRRPRVGAATLLFHADFQRYTPWIVLEGAPGQGKSTISQYVVQVHRMRLLNCHDQLAAIPDHHRSGPVRLPVKLDLRDLATWLARKDPFSPDTPDAVPHGWHRSLEAFIAAHIGHYSGGADFTVADLQAIGKQSAMLLVCDGLDEVADISRRREVVEEVVRGVKRLKEITASLQVVVTSRPAAFANSPGLPETSFPYFQLDSVTPALIDEYSDKWLRARKLQGREAAEVKRILKAKLEQPHLRDLARNPMQLAILLSLIHTRGSSLPDKRTALYDSYTELFFNREAEKSAIVREHRDLLIDIHRFLAWRLHVDAEQAAGTGSIAADKLRALLEDYLQEEKRDPSLAGELFTGMIERVVALVSRVEGTFEFEVQPLREYFAARYLYETAPYSPPGAEKRGAKPDRFDALARDFYWLNVTRFYAGCFSKGELPALVDRLQDLTRQPGYDMISHPRLLAATLLSDWVFAQHQRSVEQVVSLILDGIGLRFLLSSQSRRVAGGTPLVLPRGCGRAELIDRCFAILRDIPPWDYAYDVIDLLRANADYTEVYPKWRQEVVVAPPRVRHWWLHCGVVLGVVARIPLRDLRELIPSGPSSSRELGTVFAARRWDYLESTEELCEIAVNAILARDYPSPVRHNIEHSLERLSQALCADRYLAAFVSPQPVALNRVGDIAGGAGLLLNKDRASPAYRVLEDCDEVYERAYQALQLPARSWATTIAPWESLVEPLRSKWGERWAFAHLANIAAGVKSSLEKCADADNLFAHDVSLCRRTRYARLRAGSVVWWQRHLEAAQTQYEHALAALLFMSWAGESTIVALVRQADSLLRSMPARQWVAIHTSLRDTFPPWREGFFRKSLNLDTDRLPVDLSERVVTALSIRADDPTREGLFRRYLQSYDGSDAATLAFCQSTAAALLARQGAEWQPLLRVIAKSYEDGAISEPYAYHTFVRGSISAPQFDPGAAHAIMTHPECYPAFLVAVAERQCREELASKIVPVGVTAAAERWAFT